MDLFHVKEASQLLKVTEDATRKLISRRKIPFRRVGGRIVFLKEELEDWIKNAPGVKPHEVNR